MMEKKHWKVGELAKLSGLTVRTLHHYDQIGLFSPSKHTETGHRLYSDADLERLQQILSLKQLGFGLDEIKKFITSPTFRPLEVIKIQLEKLNEDIRIQEELRRELEQLYEFLNQQRDVSVERFIKLIEVMKMTTNKYFTEEQLENLKKRSEQFGPEKIKEVQNEWSTLIERVRKLMEKNTPVESDEVQELAKRWRELTNIFSGGDPKIVEAAERFHAENPNNPIQFGIDGPLYKYIKKALEKLS